MVTIHKRNKALSVSPLKSSQPMGATLAFLGMARAIPMLHGSQGCTAFGKVFFVRHFREPIPLQTTAMDQISTIMGSNESVVEGLKTICEKSRPDLIGLLSTGLSETQGSDIHMAVREFRRDHPEFADVAVVPVSTPDFIGGLESGFALALEAIIETLVPEAASAGTQPGRRQRQINVLAGSHLTPGDVEALGELIEGFGLRPLFLPDIGDSLDGHLIEADNSPLTVGGSLVSELATLGDAAATLVIGRSLERAADRLRERTGVPDHRFDHLYGLQANDRLVDLLQQLSGQPVPPRIERQRSQLQDAMLDSHFMLGMSRWAVALDPDQLAGFAALGQEIGAEVVAAVVPHRAPVLESLPCAEVAIGDLQTLERAAQKEGAELLIGNAHAAASAERLDLPLLRAGFPLYDRVGAYRRTWIGYRGSRDALFDLANSLLARQAEHEIQPYRSIYADRPGEDADGRAEAAAGGR